SIRAVTVSPLREASAFASRRSPSSKRTVVLMHPSMHAMTYVCQIMCKSFLAPWHFFWRRECRELALESGECRCRELCELQRRKPRTAMLFATPQLLLLCNVDLLLVKPRRLRRLVQMAYSVGGTPYQRPTTCERPIPSTPVENRTVPTEPSDFNQRLSGRHNPYFSENVPVPIATLAMLIFTT